MSDETSTSRTAVKTYVPAYQKEIWQTHADELGMSQSEFVRTMVQAGRRHFSTTETSPDVESAESKSGEEPSTDRSQLSERVRQQLSSEHALTWDELVAELTDDVESRLEETLDELQTQNAVKYSGRDGGYLLVES